MCLDKVTEQSGHHRASQGIGDEKGYVNFAARKRRLQKLNGGFWIENRWITYEELLNYILENVSRQGYRTLRAS